MHALVRTASLAVCPILPRPHRSSACPAQLALPAPAPRGSRPTNINFASSCSPLRNAAQPSPFPTGVTDCRLTAFLVHARARSRASAGDDPFAAPMRKLACANYELLFSSGWPFKLKMKWARQAGRQGGRLEGGQKHRRRRGLGARYDGRKPPARPQGLNTAWTCPWRCYGAALLSAVRWRWPRCLPADSPTE